MSRQQAQQHYSNGLQLMKSGDPAAAEMEFRSALRLERSVPLYWKSLALALFEQQNYELADKAVRKSIRLFPRDRSAYVLLFEVADAGRQWDTAIPLLEEGSRLFSEDAFFPFHLGQAYFMLGDAAKALTHFEAAHALCPEDLLALEFIKNCYARLQGSEGGARQFLHKACREPDNHRQLQAACSYAADYCPAGDVLEALRHLPENPCTLQIRLSLLQKDGQLRAALALSRRLLQEQAIAPTRCLEHYRLCCQLGEFAEARAAMQKILSNKERIERIFGAHLLTINCCPYLTPEEMFDVHRITGLKLTENITRLDGMRPGCKNQQGAPRQKPVKGLLRIGFMGGDFRRHSVGYFALPVVSHLHALGHVVHLYHTSPATDDFTARFQANSSKFTYAYLEQDGKLAERIKRDRLDVLIDLSGHTVDNRLPIFAYRPASLQATWLGYSTTTAIPEMDLWISDAVLSPPGGPERYTEQLVRLPRPWLAYQPFKEVSLARPKGRPKDEPPLFACINTMQKLSEPSIQLYSKVLAAAPGSRLLIKNKEVDCAETRAGLIQAFAAFGVGEERLMFRGFQSSFAEHAATLHSIDLTLDTTPYSGATTTCDTLWLGLPVLTLTGDLFISRMSTSVLHACGLQDWCAASEQAFIEKAVRFAEDSPALDDFRQTVRSKMQNSPLMDTMDLTRALLEVFN